jgi:hypothetical protein
MLAFELFYIASVVLVLGVSVATYLNWAEVETKEVFESALMAGLPALVFLILLLGYFKALFPNSVLWAACILLIISLLVRIKNLRKLKFKLPGFRLSSFIVFCVLFITIILFFRMYHVGAFSYPHLEDTDPWEHATCSNYVSLNHTFLKSTEQQNLHYLAPYPPVYSSLMGVVKQVSAEKTKDILKELNVGLITLGLLFAFIYFKKRVGQTKALLITMMLAITPCYMSHFIWAQTLSLILWFPALYFLDKSIYEKPRNLLNEIMAALSIGSVLITQPTTGFIFGLFLIVYFISNLLTSRAFNPLIIKQFYLQASGLAFALTTYWFPMLFLYGPLYIKQHIGISKEPFIGNNTIDTSGGIIYSLQDIVIPAEISKIDQATGIGLAASVLLAVSLAFYLNLLRKNLSTKEDSFLLLWLLWFVVALVGLEGNALPMKLFPHRFWAYLAIAVAFLVGSFLGDATKWLKKHNPVYAVFFMMVTGLCLFQTSLPQKMMGQQAHWPPNLLSWGSSRVLDGYLKFSETDGNVPVLDLCDDNRVDGLNFYSYDWEMDVVKTKERVLADESFDAENLQLVVNKYDFKYITLDTSCKRKIGENGLLRIHNKLSSIYNYKTYGENNLVIFLTN